MRFDILGVPSTRPASVITRSVAAAIALAMSGCSAIVAPDTRRLAPGSDAIDASDTIDAGVASGPDAFVGPTPDTGSTAGSIAPSNVEATLLDQGMRDLVVEAAAVFDTTMCSATSADARQTRQRDGSEVCVLLVRDLRITEAGTLRAFGSRPLVILASGNVEIDGTLDVSARGSERGAGGGVGGRPSSPDGEGPARGLAGRTNGVYSDGGGGGGGLCSGGGRGGRGGSAEGGTASPGLASILEPLTGGGGGGLGPGGARPVPDGNAGVGGGGGGAVQITARGTLRVRGRILAGGGAGGGGNNDDRFTNWGAGGGGGGGGGILLEATTLRVEASASLLASGGSGGAGSSRELRPANGGDGREATAPVTGGMGGGTYGSSGGGSGAGSSPEGDDGGANTTDGANGGGGGGGAGCIVLRAPGGAARPSASLSPSMVGVSLLPIHTR